MRVADNGRNEGGDAMRSRMADRIEKYWGPMGGIATVIAMGSALHSDVEHLKLAMSTMSGKLDAQRSEMTRLIERGDTERRVEIRELRDDVTELKARVSRLEAELRRPE